MRSNHRSDPDSTNAEIAARDFIYNITELHVSRKQGSKTKGIWPSAKESQEAIELSVMESRTALIPNPSFDRSQAEALLMLDRHIFQRIDPLPAATSSNWIMHTGSTEVPFLTAFRQPSLVSLRTEVSGK